LLPNAISKLIYENDGKDNESILNFYLKILSTVVRSYPLIIKWEDNLIKLLKNIFYERLKILINNPSNKNIDERRIENLSKLLLHNII